jgi:hypothetical protein
MILSDHDYYELLKWVNCTIVAQYELVARGSLVASTAAVASIPNTNTSDTSFLFFGVRWSEEKPARCEIQRDVKQSQIY